jgi:O-antigen ligase
MVEIAEHLKRLRHGTRLWDSVADMAILLSAMLALLPLILTPYVLFYWDITPKILVLLVGVAIALPLGWREGRAHSPVLQILGWLLVAQAVSLALSTALSIDPALSLGGSAWRRFGLITQAALLFFTWLVAQHTAGRADRGRLLLRVIAAAGIPAAIYGIAQYFGWDPLIDPASYHIGEAPLTIVRPPGTLGYVSYFATYLLSVIFAGVALMINEESRVWGLVGAAAGALGAVALILTGTRAALLGLACGAVFLVVWLQPRMGARVIVAGLVAVAVMAGFYFSPAGQMLRSRMRWFIEDPAGGARPFLWRDALRMAGTRWFAGFGPETFSINFPRYQSAELARAYPGFYQESPHNIFIDALAGQGVLGLAALAGITALGFYAVRKVQDRRMAAVLGAALTATLISQQFTSFTLPTALFFYLTVALLVGQAFLPVQHSGVNRLVVLGPYSVVAVIFLVFAVTLVTADAALARVDRLIRAGQPQEAAAVYRKFEPWQPPGMRTDVWYARAMAGGSERAQNRADVVAAGREALVAAVRATRNAEEPQNAWLNLAFFYGRQNDFPHTEQALRAAIQAAPNWYKPHWLLAQVLRAGGRLPEASVEAALAADLDGGKNPEVSRTLAEIRAVTNTSQK